jgi:hypothetical protein
MVPGSRCTSRYLPSFHEFVTLTTHLRVQRSGTTVIGTSPITPCHLPPYKTLIELPRSALETLYAYLKNRSKRQCRALRHDNITTPSRPTAQNHLRLRRSSGLRRLQSSNELLRCRGTGMVDDLCLQYLITKTQIYLNRSKTFAAPWNQSQNKRKCFPPLLRANPSIIQPCTETPQCRGRHHKARTIVFRLRREWDIYRAVPIRPMAIPPASVRYIPVRTTIGLPCS